MIYTTTRCPHCGQLVEQSAGYDDDLNRRIGPPIASCPSCGKSYQTGRKYWAQMTAAEQRKIYTLQIFGGAIGGLKVALIIWMVCAGLCHLMAENGMLKRPAVPSGESDPILVALAVPSLLVGYAYVIQSRLSALKSYKLLGL
jgi:uncharacterized C2H2 Zn-finger protein